MALTCRDRNQTLQSLFRLFDGLVLTRYRRALHGGLGPGADSSRPSAGDSRQGFAAGLRHSNDVRLGMPSLGVDLLLLTTGVATQLTGAILFNGRRR